MLKKLVRLFWEVFKISLFVLGGGYAIIVVANEVFGKRLKWLKEGELLEQLPVLQMVPGLIAGNSAIYVGLKSAGRLGAVVALVAAALPSFVIFLGVSYGYSMLPADNVAIDGAMLGLRSAITGLVFATLIKGWGKSVIGLYGHVTVVIASALLMFAHMNVAIVLSLAMLAGIAWKFCGGETSSANDSAVGVVLDPLSKRTKILAFVCALAIPTVFIVIDSSTFLTFVKFGFLGFGGGYALVPLYLQEFVGSGAAQLQLPHEEFANLMALTQTTPGPISINAATFFGYRLHGAIGAAIATVGLLLPSLFLLTALLTGLSRFKSSRIVQGILWGVRPATNALILNAGVAFASMSVFTMHRGFSINYVSLAIAGFAGVALKKTKISVMAIIFICAASGALIWYNVRT